MSQAEPSEAVVSVRALAEQAFSRAAGAPLVPGNSIRLLRDAQENYPAWLDAIAGAKRFIHFEATSFTTTPSATTSAMR